jgi:DNA-binding HxlR family transcriptional regulator
LPNDGVCKPSAQKLTREMLTRVGDKWTVLVISTLSRGPLRFTRIMAEVPGISHRMLTQTLRNLKRDGLVDRTSYPEMPPRVEYELTALGTTLFAPLSALIGWVDEHSDEVYRNRAAAEG